MAARRSARPVGVRQVGLHDQAIAVLRESVAHEAEHRAGDGRLLEQPSFLIDLLSHLAAGIMRSDISGRRWYPQHDVLLPFSFHGKKVDWKR